MYITGLDIILRAFFNAHKKAKYNPCAGESKTMKFMKANEVINLNNSDCLEK